ncbi:hypothetical protein V6767_22550, partial [Martelella sp. FLE1502]
GNPLIKTLETVQTNRATSVLCLTESSKTRHGNRKNTQLKNTEVVLESGGCRIQNSTGITLNFRT